ncbi:SNF2-related protein [Clostridium sp. SHJSY1]|uniref:DEAD/DEAH box helicase n=1 Tax=Clostridium sp. SHJSY1 TaxID=2942483 RepID=UPI002876DF0A|nr:SNF2-related protein [Clostridium sp. SHJSY1]MDS0528490.1 SNF2-related protein [Clostridium sp. SHJSY1]
MKQNELKAILFNSTSIAMKKEGEKAFNNGLVTYFKGKKIDNIYHVYGRVKSNTKEFNTHIKINLQKKKLEGLECSCAEFKKFVSSGYTIKCSHITATSYKFLSLLSKNQNNTTEKSIKEDKKLEVNETAKLIRKAGKDSLYYEVQITSRNEKLILKPNELRSFLEKIEIKKIKFKFDYIEFTVPIFHKDLPLTFNIKDFNEEIILTTQKQFPISLTPNNDVYYFKNELYLPSSNQIKNYINLYKSLKNHGEIVYKKNITNYNKLISLLGNISENVNIAESLKNFAYSLSKPDFFIFKENDTIYCNVFLNYGDNEINILMKDNSKNTFIRDYKKEEKLIMEIEKNSFTKINNKFIFSGEDEDIFNILKKKRNSIYSLGNIILGPGLKNLKIYNSTSINTDLCYTDGYYDFIYSIGEIENSELNSAFKAYKARNKFYKTKNNDFLDFEDDGIKKFFNLFEILDVDNEKIKVEKNKALYLYENLKDLGFIKNLKALEEIEEKLTNLNANNISIPSNFNGALREYQIKGFKWLKTFSELGFGGILADEMGLGKTIQTIAFLLSEKNKKTLLVCPTSLIYNWKEEFKKFSPDLKILLFHGSKRNTPLEHMNEYDVIITTYGTLRMDIDLYKKIAFDYCIIDEGQNIKNPLSKNTKVIKEIKAKIKFSLTGTPIENNLIELWSIFDFVMPGYLYSKEKFEKKFISTTDNLENLKKLINPFILRRTKKDVMTELPDKIEKKFLVEMTTSQKSIYNTYIKSVKESLNHNIEGKFEIFSYLTKLRQICLDPSLILENYSGGSGKLKIAMELIKNHINSHGKVLLFSQFTSVLNKIGETLNKESINFYHLEGKTKPKDRLSMVNDFNSSNSTNVFLISLKAGGTGLNLTSANLVIHFDPWWNPAVEDQATDRAHRIGQKNIVNVIKLVAKGTIEEKILLLQEDKKELTNDILTGELQDGKLLNGLSKEDLLQLFDRN